MKKIVLINLLLSLLIITSCKQNVQSEFYVHPKVECNYLLYMGADNNLERFGIQNIKALQEIGSNSNVNFLVLFDRNPSYERNEDNRTGTDLFFITKNPQKMNDDIIKEFGELNMTDSNNLYSFLSIVNQYFPARHTVLNIWSHGYGVYPDGIMQRSVIADYSTGYSKSQSMPIYKLCDSIKKYEDDFNKYIDVIQFDSCDMQMIEVMYELKNVCDFCVGSETSIPAQGSDYKSIANYLTNMNQFDAKKFSSFLLSSFFEHNNKGVLDFTYSAIETKKLDKFIDEFDLFCAFLLSNDDIDLSLIRNTLLPTDESYTEFIDLFEFVNEFSLIYSGFNDLIFCYNDLVIDNKSTKKYENLFGGLGINFPYTEEHKEYYFNSNLEYKILDFYIDTKWSKVITKILTI